MQYRQYVPADSLRNLVRYYWSLDGRQFSISRLNILSFADRYPRLIFQDVDCFEPIIDDETGKQMPLCYLKGVRTRPTEVFMQEAFSHFGVSFYPHALTTFFGMGADELTNLMPDINMWSLARPLIEEWMAANRGFEARARQALGEAAARIEELPTFVANLEKSAAMLASGGVRLHPDALAALSGGRRRIWPWIALLALAAIVLIAAITSS